MNRKVIAGAAIALAAGIAAYIYNRKRNRLNVAAEDAYDKMNDIMDNVETKTESIFS